MFRLMNRWGNVRLTALLAAGVLGVTAVWAEAPPARKWGPVLMDPGGVEETPASTAKRVLPPAHAPAPMTWRPSPAPAAQRPAPTALPRPLAVNPSVRPGSSVRPAVRRSVRPASRRSEPARPPAALRQVVHEHPGKVIAVGDAPQGKPAPIATGVRMPARDSTSFASSPYQTLSPYGGRTSAPAPASTRAQPPARRHGLFGRKRPSTEGQFAQDKGAPAVENSSSSPWGWLLPKKKEAKPVATAPGHPAAVPAAWVSGRPPVSPYPTTYRRPPAQPGGALPRPLPAPVQSRATAIPEKPYVTTGMAIFDDAPVTPAAAPVIPGATPARAPAQPSRPAALNIDQLRQRVRACCGQAAKDVQVVRRPDGSHEVQVKAVSAEAAQGIPSRVLQLPEMMTPNVHLSMEIAQ